VTCSIDVPLWKVVQDALHMDQISIGTKDIHSEGEVRHTEAVAFPLCDGPASACCAGIRLFVNTS